MNKKKYQIFTPNDTVNRMLDLINYSGEQIITKQIIDLSCGNGAFLKNALKRLIEECLKKNYSKRAICDICRKNIHGCETDKDVFKSCINNLNDVLCSYLNIKSILWTNVNCCDGLQIKTKCFDYVVGNPPYISYRDMSKEQREYLRNNFNSCSKGRFDYSYAFIELSVELLNRNGVASIIAPLNMYKIKSGGELRKQLLPYIYRIIDVSDENIFPRVLTNPAITIFKKNIKNKKFHPFICENETKTQDGERRFGDFYIVRNGVATLLNEAFLVNNEIKLENDILKAACSPRFSRYCLDYKIIFPYYYENDVLKHYSEEEFKNKFPKAYKHISKFKTKLKLRSVSENTQWFEYGKTQALDVIKSKKIMISSIATNCLKPVLLDKDDVVCAGFYVVAKDPLKSNLDDAFEILSQKRLYNYIKDVGVKMSGNSYRFSTKDLENYRY